ncbi:ROK family protein [Frigoribacterium sp. CFBP 13729]|nr:ROK family protein [Frigoribacterium sp. CFBP 8766]MBD8583560.1 ROK family protein [Frigoribacterium sp. CFBP 8766]MBD8610338.1 ROK family protein [Frigoribacterium sp. CFBP 13729]
MRIGIDVGGTKIDAIILGDDTGVRKRVRRETVSGPDGVLCGIRAVVDDLLDGHDPAAQQVTHVGVGIPGVVDGARGMVMHAVNLDIHELDLASILAAALGTRVTVDNDVNAAATGAAHLIGGAAPLGYLNLGTGLAAGVVVDGHVWRGSRGGAGEIGHIPADPNGYACLCGQRGCLETVASGTALAKLWPSTSVLPAVDLFDAADRGDARARQVRGVLVHGVASAVRLLLLSTDVEDVVIGGGLSNLGERLLEPVRGVFVDWSARSPFLASLGIVDRVQLLPPGVPAAAVGAALL